MSPRCQDDIFLKHPITGEITVHQHPYGDMPRFRMKTAHPSLVAANTSYFLHNSGGYYDDPIHVLARVRSRIVWPPRQPDIKEIVDHPWQAPSREQKAYYETAFSPLLSTHERRTAIVALKALEFRMLSSPIRRKSRKRKTHPDTSAPGNPPAKRVYAGATRNHAGEVETRIFMPCSNRVLPRRDRAAKTMAIARMRRQFEGGRRIVYITTPSG